MRAVAREVELPADPVLVAARLADLPGFTGLVGTGPAADARFSIFAAFPSDELALPAGTRADGSDPFGRLRPKTRAIRLDDLPSGLPFAGGVMAMFGYDLRGFTEKLPDRHSPDGGCPELLARWFDAVVVVDRASGRVVVTRLEPVTGEVRAAEIGGRSADHARSLHAALARDLAVPRVEARPAVHASSQLPRAEYLARVARIIRYIRAGDTYQVNFSQRFEGPARDDALPLFARLVARNPAPFGGLVRLPDQSWLISASPERFLQVDGRRVVTRPIKGTAPRATDAADDRRLAAELLASDKNRAELAMIVDLLRNDLSRSCEPGTVLVTEPLVLESHPTVHHLVATVEGRLAAQRDVFDLIRDAWPGGSITGVPKIRAMEIIDELENCRRGPYTGSLGYLGFDGRADLNILIRTLRLSGGRAWLHGGGGIVVDSDPELEWRETLHKVRGLCEALGWEIDET